MAHSSTSKNLYYVIYVVLMVLLVVTVAVAYMDFSALPPWFGLTLGIGIATVKATLVVMYFMHVADRTPLVWAFAIGGFIWLGILLALTFSDYLTRGWPKPLI